MKVIIETDDKEEAVKLLNSSRAYALLHEIEQTIFRPARKHGYSDIGIECLIKACGDSGQGEELIGYLEDMYYEIKGGLGVEDE